MKFTKTVMIEQFDCTKFAVDRLYYVHWRDARGVSIKAIYQCIDIDEEENQLLMKNIVPLKGDCPDSYTLRLGVEDTDNIASIQEVEFGIEYEVSNGRWSVTMEVVDGT